MFVWNSHKHNEHIYRPYSDIEQNKKGNEDEYNKGFFAATNAYGNTHIYLLYIY